MYKEKREHTNLDRFEILYTFILSWYVCVKKWIIKVIQMKRRYVLEQIVCFSETSSMVNSKKR